MTSLTVCHEDRSTIQDKPKVIEAHKAKLRALAKVTKKPVMVISAVAHTGVETVLHGLWAKIKAKKAD